MIFLYMSGGPSQFEKLNRKPVLERMHGRPMPDSFTRGAYTLVALISPA